MKTSFTLRLPEELRKKIIDEAEKSPLLRPTIVWIDEIHRLTRPQQDLLLRSVEDGLPVIASR